MAGQEKP